VPKLVVHDTDRTYLVDLRPGESLLLGRSLDCDLPLTAQRASRRHAEVLSSATGHTLRDLGSTNGTTVSGAPFTGDAPLKDGDVLELGGCRIEYWSRP
jgi:pSer/pThr/pTyr-binding forkhead associated (FHA) protein